MPHKYRSTAADTQKQAWFRACMCVRIDIPFATADSRPRGTLGLLADGVRFSARPNTKVVLRQHFVLVARFRSISVSFT